MTDSYKLSIIKHEVKMENPSDKSLNDIQVNSNINNDLNKN